VCQDCYEGYLPQISALATPAKGSNAQYFISLANSCAIMKGVYMHVHKLELFCLIECPQEWNHTYILGPVTINMLAASDRKVLFG
jgi:hypothetical protein